MKDLLKLMLVHYYTDSKRSTNATITRKVDAGIREIASKTTGLPNLVRQCRQEAEAAKRQARTAKSKSPKSWHHHGNPRVQHIPCRERRR